MPATPADEDTLDAGPRAPASDAGALPPLRPPPEPLEPHAELPAELVATVAAEHSLPGIGLEAVWTWPRAARGAPEVADVNASGIEAALAATERRWHLDVATAGRLRVSFDAPSLPLAQGAELRMREERYGSVVLWPGGSQYRVIQAGALRTVLEELRVDAMPLGDGKVTAKAKGILLGYASRTVEVQTPLGTLELELGEVREAGEGGPLLCRLLVELAGADPSSTACAPFELPLRADYLWPSGDGARFEVQSVERREALEAEGFAMPPEGARRMRSGLPEPDEPILPNAVLRALRAGDATSPEGPTTAANRTDRAAYVLVDGVPVGLVAPGRERRLGVLRAGHYRVQWRSFLGRDVEPEVELALPGRIVREPEREAP
ncbi:MAG: hypothetical protein HY908_18685 [Myxococcales bacterium]|nr:hypothetical protein [Myxococcales bacterium]